MTSADPHAPAASKPHNPQGSHLQGVNEQPLAQSAAAAVAQEAEERDPAVVCSIALATPLTLQASTAASKPAKQPAKKFGSLQEELAAAVKARQAAAATHQQPSGLQPDSLSSQIGSSSEQKSRGTKGPPPPPPLPPRALKQPDSSVLQKASPAPPPPPAPPTSSLTTAKIAKPGLSRVCTPPKVVPADKAVRGPRASGASPSPAKASDFQSASLNRNQT